MITALKNKETSCGVQAPITWLTGAWVHFRTVIVPSKVLTKASLLWELLFRVSFYGSELSLKTEKLCSFNGNSVLSERGMGV